MFVKGPEPICMAEKVGREARRRFGMRLLIVVAGTFSFFFVFWSLFFSFFLVSRCLMSRDCGISALLRISIWHWTSNEGIRT